MILKDWTDEKAKAFGKETLSFSHDLHERPLFTDEGLAEALEAYPRARLGVFTMGEDPTDWTTWRKGSADGLSGAQLLDAAKSGRIWLNLREANLYLKPYADLAEEVFAEKEAMAPGLKTFKRDLGLLISSANAQVFYHLDVPLVSLWQIRGVKQVYVYPPKAPFVGEEALEKIVLRETAEQFAFDPALMRANVIYANGVLRRRAGLRPRLAPGFGPGNIGKVALARGAKALNLQKPNERVLPATFRLDAAQPGAVLPL